MALPLFAVTLFVSAFLLFLVQPMIGKMILPKLGGTPQVWNTCMLFFQMTLLAGYAYTHNLSTRLATRLQLMVHAVLLGVPVVVLLVTGVFDVSSWFPNPSGIPVLQALSELALLVGVPFFVVSTSAPLLQKWFINTGHPAASDPYFLYGASNLGSLLSLLFYPFLYEPWFTLREQALIWFGGYIALLCLIAACIAMVWKSPLSLLPVTGGPDLPPELPIPPPDAPPAPTVQPQTSTAVKSGPAPGTAHQRGITRKKGLKAQVRTPAAVGADDARSYSPIVSRPSDAPVTAFRRLRWILLAAVPSSLMLGVTSYISTDLSPFPLIWIVPLALYLLSFILVYMRWPITWTSSDSSTTTPHALVMYIIQPLGILGMCFVLLTGGFHWGYMILAWAAFFATALACHGELAKDRPHPRYLTEYFLLMSVGGAVGGFLNAIVAPLVFPGVWEFYIALVLSCFVRPVLLQTNWTDSFLMSSFPGVQAWAREQSDQLSRSFGRPATGSTYVLSFTLDVLLGLSMIAVAYMFNSQREWVFSFIRFTGISAIGANALPLMIYGIPLVICGLYSSRPVRFGLAITMLLSMHLMFRTRGEDRLLFEGRTYFGVLRVLEGTDNLRAPDAKREFMVAKDPEEFENFSRPPKDRPDAKPQSTYRYTYLMHGTTYHGRNYIYDPAEDNVDLSRLATTYYYRYGPVGVVLERFNWFPGPQNSFWGDLRMPATMVGDVAAMIGTGTLPNAALVNAYSEPPLATIGLGTGTMASYARPYGHFTYYEIDEQIRNFSLPPRGESAYFTYLLGAMRRGVNLEIIMGDARLSIEKPQLTLFPVLPYDTRLGVGDPEQAKNNHPDLESLKNKLPKDREHYYKAINVDAFSSDAIPVHLVTLEAIQLYMKKISYDGVLCVHTSNRHLDLLRPVAKIVEVLDEQFQREYKEKTPLEEFGGGPRPENMKRLKAMVGKDNPMRPEGARPGEDRSKFLGHFSSEYIMVYYDEKYLKPAKNYVSTLPDGKNYNIYQDRSTVIWHAPKHLSPSPWTDDYSNLVRIMRGLPVFGINNEFD